ncbi:unnamed protein product [Cryptosporidium hominis]|uniref:Uncharacterized protein n=1 Tax=Cryptosporidium hominis TaxID=237895 RepID=A0A0S4TJH8_CRYHO|nr:hypothetical protein ChTU502y2012_407g0430 [Cryptosporidium hominis]PPA62800.1 hypothetical protein ChUKH1_17755 [Cryptosporidium hominis]CUV07065.1 unnamed protein product [Cryptosporidium hominis]
MKASRYHQILNQWIGKTKGFIIDENRDANTIQVAGESKLNKNKDSDIEWGSKWRFGENENDNKRGEKELVGVVSSIPSLTDIIRPFGDLPNDVYMDIMSKYKCFLHELKLKLIEIFRINSEKFKIQYKLDIVDERLALVEELGQEVYKLSAADLARIHTQKDKEECLMVDRLVPVVEKAKSLIIVEEEKFLLELNSKLRTNLDQLTKEFHELQTQISQVDKQLKDADKTSNSFITDAIETFRKWSENAKEVIKAVERAN